MMTTQEAMFAINVRGQVGMQFELMRSFINNSEGYFNEKMPLPDVYELSDGVSTFVDHHNPIEHINITQILRYNTIVSVVTLLEAHFIAIAESLKPKNITLDVTEIKRENIVQPYTYLVKVLGYNISSITKEMSTFKDVYRIRNIIVHRNGFLKNEGDQAVIEKYTPDLSVNDKKHLVVESNKFANDLCQKAEQLLSSVIDALIFEFKKY